MPTIIAIHPSGFEVRFEVELTEISDMARKLEKRRYRPTRELVYTAEGLPICPRHGVPMLKRTKQNDTWNSHKVTDPDTGQVAYCRGYASPSSPGYDIDPVRSVQSGRNGRRGPNGGNPASPPRDNVADLDALNEQLFG